MFTTIETKRDAGIDGVIKNQYAHGFHMVTPSPWPFFAALGIMCIILNFVGYLHFYPISKILFPFSVLFLILIVSRWWRDVVIEATFEGKHTSYVQKGLRISFILFILSEVMFFFGFFWGFFHSSLAPSIFIGAVWPPEGITVFDWQGVPLLNTVILLTSGATLTLAHKSFFLLVGETDAGKLVNKNTSWSIPVNFGRSMMHFPLLGSGRYENKDGYHSMDRVYVFKGLFLTVFLGLLFTCVQLYEYITAPFSISDGIYGSTFFVCTGFHGLHVLVGTAYLIVNLFRHYYYHFSKQHHVGFDTAAWYWHFVDVVWLFLFVCIYIWGS